MSIKPGASADIIRFMLNFIGNVDFTIVENRDDRTFVILYMSYAEKEFEIGFFEDREKIFDSAVEWTAETMPKKMKLLVFRHRNNPVSFVIESIRDLRKVLSGFDDLKSFDLFLYEDDFRTVSAFGNFEDIWKSMKSKFGVEKNDCMVLDKVIAAPEDSYVKLRSYNIPYTIGDFTIYSPKKDFDRPVVRRKPLASLRWRPSDGGMTEYDDWIYGFDDFTTLLSEIVDETKRDLIVSYDDASGEWRIDEALTEVRLYGSEEDFRTGSEPIDAGYVGGAPIPHSKVVEIKEELKGYFMECETVYVVRKLLKEKGGKPVYDLSQAIDDVLEGRRVRIREIGKRLNTEEMKREADKLGRKLFAEWNERKGRERGVKISESELP